MVSVRDMKNFIDKKGRLVASGGFGGNKISSDVLNRVKVTGRGKLSHGWSL